MAEYPGKVDWYERLSAARSAGGDLVGAANALRELVVVDPSQAAAHRYLGHVEFDRGEFAAARDAYAAAVRLAPDEPEWVVDLARAEIALGDVAAARERLLTVERGQPGYASAQLELGVVAQEDDPAEAERRIRAALAADPDLPGARTRLALFYLQTRRFVEARVELEAIVAADPTDAQALNNLGTLVAQTGELEAAREYYQAGGRSN